MPRNAKVIKNPKYAIIKEMDVTCVIKCGHCKTKNKFTITSIDDDSSKTDYETVTCYKCKNTNILGQYVIDYYELLQPGTPIEDLSFHDIEGEPLES